jgi:hypothetical protein
MDIDDAEIKFKSSYSNKNDNGNRVEVNNKLKN